MIRPHHHARPGRPSDILEALRRRIDHPTALARSLNAVIQFEPWDGPSVRLRMEEGRFVVSTDTGRADTRIRSTTETLLQVVEGEESGVRAFLEGRLTVRGNLALAMQIESFFPPPRPLAERVRADYVNAGGLRTFYLESGEGTPVILLHGLGATNASMLPTLGALAGDYRILAPDNPGFGESDKPVRAYHPVFFARWVRDFMDALGIERAILIGNSMGGRIALETALRFPDRVDRLVLFAPSMAWKRFRQFVPVARVLSPQLAALPLRLPRMQVLRTLKMMFADSRVLPQTWHDAAVDEFLRVFREPRARIAFFSAAKQIYLETPGGEKGFWNRLPAMKHDALFLWGDKDLLVPASFARHATDALPHARSIILRDCGHVPQFEHDDETHVLVRSFLRGDLHT